MAVARHVSVLAALFAWAAVWPPLCEGALNIDADAAQDLVRDLRRAIFVETAFLAERPAVVAATGSGRACSSLDGPRCFQAAFGGGDDDDAPLGSAAAALDGPGVLPEMLLRDLGVPGAEELNFVTPEFSVLEAARRQHVMMAEQLDAPVLHGMHSAEELQRARSEVSGGFLHFSGLQPDSRLPLSFSRGLPGGVVATWDGRWLARGCGSGSGSDATLALPASGDEDPNALGLVVARFGSDIAGLPSVGAGADRQSLSVTAELTGSLGYIRFSRPVVVKSLFARWSTTQNSPALIGGRLGLETSWATHLEPTRLREGTPGAWLDIAGPLRPVDEIAFVGASGIEVGAMAVLAPEASDDEVRSVLMLAPIERRAGEADEGEVDGAEAPPKFELKVQTVSLAAAPYLASLEEVVQNNLRLLPTRRPRGGPSAPALPTPGPEGGLPGMLSAQAPLPLRSSNEATALRDAAWIATAGANEEMFKHFALLPLMQLALTTAAARSGASMTGGPFAGGVTHKLAAEAFKALTQYLCDSGENLPLDLRRALPKESEEIAEAVWSWVEAGGGWRRHTPSMLPRGGSDDALARYASAKRRQTKLDLLTAAFLHKQKPEGYEEQVQSALQMLQRQLQAKQHGSRAS